MQIKALFPTPVVVHQLDDLADLALHLRERILAREAQSPGVVHSNVDGWQSDADLFDWIGPAAATVERLFRDAANGVTLRFDGATLTRDPIAWRISCWANINRARGHNQPHVHPGSYWSACFYVDDGGIDGREDMGGAIEFVDPRGPVPVMSAPHVKMAIANCTTAGLAERIYPKTGLLLLFPSWLTHSVTPYLGTGTRISVTANLAV